MQEPSFRIDLYKERARLVRRSVDSGYSSANDEALFQATLAITTGTSEAILMGVAVGTVGVVATGASIVGGVLGFLYIGLSFLVSSQYGKSKLTTEQSTEKQRTKNNADKPTQSREFFESNRPSFDAKDPNRGGYDHVSPSDGPGKESIDSRNVA